MPDLPEVLPRDSASIKRVFEQRRSGQGTGVEGTNDAAQAERRRELMDAAVGLAAHGGLEALRIRAVVARTGVSSATIYRYFASKEHLLVAAPAERRFALGPPGGAPPRRRHPRRTRHHPAERPHRRPHQRPPARRRPAPSHDLRRAGVAPLLAAITQPLVAETAHAIRPANPPPPTTNSPAPSNGSGSPPSSAGSPPAKPPTPSTTPSKPPPTNSSTGPGRWRADRRGRGLAVTSQLGRRPGFTGGAGACGPRRSSLLRSFAPGTRASRSPSCGASRTLGMGCWWVVVGAALASFALLPGLDDPPRERWRLLAGQFCRRLV